MGRTGAVNTDEDREPEGGRGRCSKICAPVLDVFLPWLIGELVPFGDLVTDIWLWFVLPATMPDSFDCSEGTYKKMRIVLGIGALISAVPVAAVLVGIIVGLTGVVVGGLAFVAHRQDGEHIVGMAKDLLRYSRYALADGKATAGFLIHNTAFGAGRGATPRGWEHTVEVVVNAMMAVVHAPLFLLAYGGCCWFVPRENRVFLVFVIVQVAAGVMTTTASFFFARASGEPLAWTSFGFGLYSLLVGTVVALKEPDGQATAPGGTAGYSRV